MNNPMRLVGLQRDWTLPRGLGFSRPRTVALTGAGKTLLAVAITLFVAAVVAAVFLSAMVSRQAEEQRLMLEEAVETNGRITRLWRTRGEENRYWLAYEFTAHGRTYERSLKVSRRTWDQLKVGSSLPVRYVPSNPAINHPRDWRSKRPTPAWIPTVVAVVLAISGWLVTLPIQSQRRLLAEGRAAPGLVTGHTAEHQGQATIQYAFPLLSGATRTGKSGPSKKPPAIGSTICVLYDPEQPRRNATYPMSLVRIE